MNLEVLPKSGEWGLDPRMIPLKDHADMRTLPLVLHMKCPRPLDPRAYVAFWAYEVFEEPQIGTPRIWEASYQALLGFR